MVQIRLFARQRGENTDSDHPHYLTVSLRDTGRGIASYHGGLRRKQREQPLNRVAIPLGPGSDRDLRGHAPRSSRIRRGGRPYRDESGYSSLRQARGSSAPAFGVRLSRNELYGATNGSGAVTV